MGLAGGENKWEEKLRLERNERREERMREMPGAQSQAATSQLDIRYTEVRKVKSSR